MMNYTRPLTLVMMIIAFSLIACSQSPQDAITHVLLQDQKIGAASDANFQTYGAPKAVQIMTSAMRGINLNDCPTDFRQAYILHIQAWDNFGQYAARTPSDPPEGFVSGFLNGLAGEMDGGITRMQRTSAALSQDIKNTYFHIERIAISYGATLPQ